MTEQQKDSMLLAFFVGFAMLLFVLLLGMHVAWSHEFYSSACCGDRDCRPVACEEIHSAGDRWEYSGKFIEKFKTQASPDGKCHVCIGNLPWSVSILCIYMGGES
jgi:hypothetical protein